MEKKFLEISPRYIVDNAGKKTQVILEIDTYENLLERLEDLYFGLEAEQALHDGEYIDFDEANKKVLIK